MSKINKHIMSYMRNNIKDTDDFRKVVEDITKNKYKVLGTYHGSRVPIKILWLKYNWIFKESPIYFLQHKKCPWNKSPKTRIYSKYISKITDNKYKVISKYIGCWKPITILWVKYNWTFKTTPRDFKDSHFKCPWPKAPRTEIYNNYIRRITHGKYKIISNYISAYKPITILWLKYNWTFRTTPKNFKDSHFKCPWSKSPKTKLYRNYIKKITHGNYKVIGKYTGSDKPTSILWLKYNLVFRITPHSFKKANFKCPHNHRPKTKIFQQKLDALYGKNKYITASKYKNDHKTILIKHVSCGKVFKTTPNVILEGHGCRRCSFKKRAINQTHSTKWFSNIVDRITNHHYLVLGKYKNGYSNIKLLHKDCGHIFYVKPNNFLQGSRCPDCITFSKGETLVSNIFYANHIHKYNSLNKLTKVKNGYIHSYVPDWLCGLHLDFLLKLNNHYFGIEFDGVQHFKPVDFSGNGYDKAKIDFLRGQSRDSKKNHLCKKNSKITKLIRIKNIKNLEKPNNISKLILDTFNNDKTLMKVANHKFGMKTYNC